MKNKAPNPGEIHTGNSEVCRNIFSNMNVLFKHSNADKIINIYSETVCFVDPRSAINVFLSYFEGNISYESFGEEGLRKFNLTLLKCFNAQIFFSNADGINLFHAFETVYLHSEQITVAYQCRNTSRLLRNSSF